VVFVTVTVISVALLMRSVVCEVRGGFVLLCARVRCVCQRARRHSTHRRDVLTLSTVNWPWRCPTCRRRRHTASVSLHNLTTSRDLSPFHDSTSQMLSF